MQAIFSFSMLHLVSKLLLLGNPDVLGELVRNSGREVSRCIEESVGKNFGEGKFRKRGEKG